MSHIKVGDRVQFPAGRGYRVGRVINIDSGRARTVVEIATEAGKKVNRLLSAVTLVLKSEIVETEKAEAAESLNKKGEESCSSDPMLQ